MLLWFRKSAQHQASVNVVGVITGLCAFMIALAVIGSVASAQGGDGKKAGLPPADKVLKGTEPLEMQGDMASHLVDAADRFLLKQLANAPAARDAHRRAAPGSLAGLSTAAPEVKRRNASKLTNDAARNELARIIGLRDARVPQPKLFIEQPADATGTYAIGDGWKAVQARWSVHEDIDAHGLWVVPSGATQIVFRAVVIPDAGQTPEHLIGVPTDKQSVVPIAAALAWLGGEVLVTTSVSRQREARRGRAVMTDQEYLYRSAFELGRHVLGYQVQETLAAVEALQLLPRAKGSSSDKLPMLVFGWGEGGWVALHSAAVCSTIDAVCVSGHFQSREDLWQEPIHRNLHGVLLNFGDAELAAMIAPNKIVIDAVPGPQVDIPGEGGAPGRLTGPSVEAARAEFARTQSILKDRQLEKNALFVHPAKMPTAEGASAEAIAATLSSLLSGSPASAAFDTSVVSAALAAVSSTKPEHDQATPWVTAQSRRQSMLTKWDRFSQRRLEHAVDERSEYWSLLKTDSIENFNASVEPYRQAFSEDVIGKWNLPLAAPRPRTRLAYETEDGIVGYEVMLDLFPDSDLFAYGVLLTHKSTTAEMKRPCVVFQHGLEGRPQDCIIGDHPAYHDVAMQLARKGYTVFAPQNLYIFHDRFRTLQRKSNPLGKSLFSIIIPSHQQICRWLASLDVVDPKRIGFYGLSYGGKSAMRIPPLVPEYWLSICSADFNDWVWKNASTHAPHSYVWTMEYEIFEFDLGSRFNYAEMATLIAPRPFMVERGHFDGVAPDDRVAAEFAKVRNLYSARLKLKDAVQLEWFVGPHTINGQGTFDFLSKKLDLPVTNSKSEKNPAAK